MRVHAYIDGFNLYYGALKGTSYKWLDLGAFCQKLAPRETQVEKVNYFTAKVHQQPGNSGVRERQRIYFEALGAHIPHLEIVYGQYRVHATLMRLLTPGDTLEQREITSKGGRIARINDRLFGENAQWTRDPGPPVHVIKLEEKGSDVNLAARLIHDGWQGLYDGALVISNDTDLSEALRIVIEEINKPVWLVSPARKTAGLLRAQLKTRPKVIFEATLRTSQLPNPVPGTNLRKPRQW